MSESRYCSTCGALLSASAALCGECGARYQESPYDRRATDAPGAWSAPPQRASRDLGKDPSQEQEDIGIQLISAADLEPPRPGATALRPADGYDHTMTSQHSAPSAHDPALSAPSAAGAEPSAHTGPVAQGPRLPYPIDYCVPASFGKRVAAAIIDALIMSLTTIPLLIGLVMVLAQGADASLLAQILVGIGVAVPAAVTVLLIWLQGSKGVYPGKLIMGLRVTSHSAGGGIGFVRSLGRWFLYGLAPWLMALSIFLDPKKTLRGFHDRIVDSVVVDLKAGRDPMLPRPDDFERPGHDHYLGDPSVAVTTDENLMVAPGSPWSAPSAGEAPGAPAAADPWAPAAEPSASAPAESPYAPPSAGSPYGPPTEPTLEQPATQEPVVNDWSPPAQPSSWQQPPGSAQQPSPWQSEEYWAAVAGGAAEHEVDEQTRISAPAVDDMEDLEQTRISPRRFAVPRLTLTLDDGTSQTVDTAVSVGRNPDQDLAPARFVIADATRSVSKSHARIDGTGESVIVTDLGSTNGTAIVHPDGRRDVLVPQSETVLPEGASLAIGDRTMTVERAS